jgi:hypothetical protein
MANLALSGSKLEGDQNCSKRPLLILHQYIFYPQVGTLLSWLRGKIGFGLVSAVKIGGTYACQISI